MLKSSEARKMYISIYYVLCIIITYKLYLVSMALMRHHVFPKLAPLWLQFGMKCGTNLVSSAASLVPMCAEIESPLGYKARDIHDKLGEFINYT